MSNRARTTLIIVILGIVLVGGGILVWLFGFGGAATLTGSPTSTAPLFVQDGKDSFTVAQGGTGVPSLDCGPRATNPAFEIPRGGGFNISYDCVNTGSDPIQIDFTQYDNELWAFNLPATDPVSRPNPNAVCYNQNDIAGFQGDWPPDTTESEAQWLGANWQGVSGPPGSCPTDPASDSQQTSPSVAQHEVQTINPGQSLTVTKQHTFTKCNYYQWDDIADQLDANGNVIGRAYLGYGIVRSFAAAGTCAPITAGDGNITVRIYSDLDSNGEYTDPPAGEGALFSGSTYQIYDSSGNAIDYTTLCDNADNAVGGAGRDTCSGLAVGTYTVEIDPLPDPVAYTGPIAEPHNTAGQSSVQVTVTAGQTTIVDFGYTATIIAGATGDLLIRKYADLNNDGEYGANGGIDPAGEGAPFFGTTYTVLLANSRTEIDYAKYCGSGDNKLGGAGRDVCTGLPTGDYNVNIADPDPAAYSGPITESHNANGDDPLRVTIVNGQQAIADFGYNQLIASPLTCVIQTKPDPAVGDAPLDVVFDGSASIPGSGNTITDYAWGFGEPIIGQTPNQAVVNHTYNSNGKYTATLTVTNSAGQTDSCDVPVSVGSIVSPQDNTLRVVAFNDKNENAKQDQGVAGPIEDGYNRATITVSDSSGNVVATKDTAPESIIGTGGGVLIDGVANFTQLPDDTYTVVIDESDTVELDQSGNTFVLQNLKRTVPSSATVTVQLPTATGERNDTVEYGYNPGLQPQALTCDITKTVSDETNADEETPDDLKASNSAPGEELTFAINWTCAGFDPNSKVGVTITDDYPENYITVTDPDGGIDDPVAGIITWSITGAEVSAGSRTWTGVITSPLAPGTYTLRNYVVISRGEIILDQDETVTTVVVAGPEFADMEVVKYARDVNGGTLQPGDVVEYYIVTTNTGNSPLNYVTVTDDMPPFVSGLNVTQIPAGAIDQSTATGGANGTGLLLVSGFDLLVFGDSASIVFQVTVDQGIPSGTEILNLVTASSGVISDTDTESVTVGGVVPIPPPAPPAGPTSGPVPPNLGPRVLLQPDDITVPDTGVGAQIWVLIASLLAAITIAGFVYTRTRPETQS